MAAAALAARLNAAKVDLGAAQQAYKRFETELASLRAVFDAKAAGKTDDEKAQIARRFKEHLLVLIQEEAREAANVARLTAHVAYLVDALAAAEKAETTGMRDKIAAELPALRQSLPQVTFEAATLRVPTARLIGDHIAIDCALSSRTVTAVVPLLMNERKSPAKQLDEDTSSNLTSAAQVALAAGQPGAYRAPPVYISLDGKSVTKFNEWEFRLAMKKAIAANK